VQKIELVSRLAEVDEDDLISVTEAAKISGRNLVTIIGMMERFALPWYQLRGIDEALPNERVQRFTSRKAVLALPPKK